MKTSGVSSRGAFKIKCGFEFVEVAATVGVLIGGEFKAEGEFEFVAAIAPVGVCVDGMRRLQAASNDTARIKEDVFKKSRRENSFFI
jgi:hypothetical protein